MGAPLTERQKAILDFFAEFQRRHGYPPTHREIRDRFGTSAVTRGVLLGRQLGPAVPLLPD